jgi:hypothetical protein
VKRDRQKKASTVFAEAIAAIESLNLVTGLGAIKRGEGKDRIHVQPAALLGSVAIDRDCRASHPEGNRWDYVIGAKRAKREHAFFVEVHSAETSGVTEVEKKLGWLLEYLDGDAQQKLRSLPREIHWVASGRVNIPKHLPQYKKLQTTLRQRGLLGPVTRLELP